MLGKVRIQPEAQAQGPQQAFLGNEGNKRDFIKMLANTLRQSGFEVVESCGDADVVIVSTAIRYCSTIRTVVVADDTDVLIMLVHHYSDEMEELFIFSETSWKSKAKVDCVSIKSIKEELGPELPKLILFVHAWTGCDTVSSIFGLGKVSILNRCKQSEVAMLAAEFYKESALPSMIEEVGIRLFAILYGAKPEQSLNEMRYSKYMSHTATSNNIVRPESLSPTESAARFHS